MIPGSAPDLPPKNIGGGGGSVGTLRITWDVSSTVYTVKILKFGTPQTIAMIVLKIEKFDVTLH